MPSQIDRDGRSQWPDHIERMARVSRAESSQYVERRLFTGVLWVL